MLQNAAIHEGVNRFQSYKFQPYKKTSTQKGTESVTRWLIQRGFDAKIRNTSNGSPYPQFPNLIDIIQKFPAPAITLQVTCPKNPEKASFLVVNFEKTRKNPSDIFIQVLDYDDTIELVGFGYHEDLRYYGPDRAIPKEATYRIYHESLRNINELPEALKQWQNNQIIPPWV